jgi:hypothetical protein
MTRTDARRLAYFGGVLSKSEYLTLARCSEHVLQTPRVDIWSHRQDGDG